MGAHHRKGRIEPARGEPRRLLERAGFQHLGKSRLDAALEQVPVRGEEKAAPLARPQRGFAAAVLEGCQRATCGPNDLERPQDPLPVGGAKPGGAGGIETLQRRVKLDRGPALGLCAQARANLVGDRRNVGETFGQRAKIEAGAADEHQRAGMAGEDLARARLVEADREIDRAVDLAEQKMRREPLLLLVRPRGEDAQIPIDLHGIGVDDRRAGLPGDAQGERGLAAGGRPCDEKRPRRIIG